MVYGRPSLESISKKTGFRLKKLMRFIDQLENRGFIEKSESDRYVITEFYRQLKWR
jgi:DNA-binding IclR family transcriptional regulator